VLKLMKDEIKK